MPAAVVVVTKAEADSIKAGASCVTLGGAHMLAFKAADGALTLAPNVCVHMGAQFKVDIEDAGKFKCTMHGVKMDGSTLEYCPGSHPRAMGMEISKIPEHTKQPTYSVVKNADGSLTCTAPEGKAGGCELA